MFCDEIVLKQKKAPRMTWGGAKNRKEAIPLKSPLTDSEHDSQGSNPDTIASQAVLQLQEHPRLTCAAQ